MPPAHVLQPGQLVDWTDEGHRGVCLPTRDAELSSLCSGVGGCVEPGVCVCNDGFAGGVCEQPVGADGGAISIVASKDATTVRYVWGMRSSPQRAIDGRPTDAALDEGVDLTSEASQQVPALTDSERVR